MNRARLLNSSMQTSVLRLLAQLVALLSATLVSGFFGTTQITDDYFSALVLPGALASLALNILTNLFPPIYVEHITRDPAQQKPILTSMSFIVGVSLLLGMIISLVGIPALIAVRALSSSDAIARAALFGVLLTLLVPINGYARLLGTVCETHQHFVPPAAAAVASPLAFVAALLATYTRLGPYSLLLANLTAAICELAIISVYAIRKLDMPLPRAGLHPAVKEMLSLSLAPAMTYTALMFVPVADRLVASALGTGDLTVFHYGERMVTVIETLVVSGSLTVLSTQWAHMSAQRGIEAVANSVSEVFGLFAFAILPVSVGGALIAQPLISVIFERGAFTAVEGSAQVFSILLLSLLPNTLIVMIVRLLLIRKDTVAQLVLSVGVSVLNAGFNFLFAPVFGLPGVALSTLVTRIIILILAYIFLVRRLPQTDIRPMLPGMARTVTSVIIMAGVLALMLGVLAPALSRAYGWFAQIAALGSTIVIGGLIYLLVSGLLHHPHLDTIFRIVLESPLMSLLRRTRTGSL